MLFELPALCLGMKPARLPAGFLGFYKGMRAKIVQSILAAALLMAIKEQLTTATAAVLDPKVTFHASCRRPIRCASVKLKVLTIRSSLIPRWTFSSIVALERHIVLLVHLTSDVRCRWSL